MGKLTLTLALDSRDATYLPGDTVSGRVLFELKKALKIRGVRVFLKGEELSGWGDKGGGGGGGGGGKRREEDLVCVGKHTYFDVAKTVFGNEEGTILNNPTLKPGRHSFPFSYRLPPVLPHSFDAGSAASAIGAVGYIRYSARGKIDVHFGSDIVSEALEFYVEGLFNVNQANDVHHPSSSSHQEVISGCCSSGIIEAGLAVRERSGFIPGNEADILAQVANSDVGRIKNCQLQLIRTVTLFANNPKGKTESRQVEHVLVCTKLAPVIKKGGKMSKVASLTIPDCVPDVFTGSKFIRVKYAVRLAMQPKGGHSFQLSSPIRIGNHRFPLELHPRSSTPADAAAAAAAADSNAAAAASDDLAQPQLPENVTHALISADFVRQNSYGATVAPANAADDAAATTTNEPSAPLPQRIVDDDETSAAVAAVAGDDDSCATTMMRPPSCIQSEFAPSATFLQDAPPPYNPGFSAMTDAAAAAVLAFPPVDVTMSETLHECGICMVNTKDCAFDCGHLACSECAEMLTECHICRERITGKRKIYL